MFHEIVALDIETDTTDGHGLDPTRAAITEIAMSFDEPTLDVVHAGVERSILLDTQTTIVNISSLCSLSLLVTWNGAGFDLPYIERRIEEYSGFGLPPKRHQPLGVARKYPPIEGDSQELYSWTWGGLRHLDIAYGFRDFAERTGTRWSLKSVARAHGIEVIELDRTRMHEYSPAEREEYALSDVRATRALALILLGDTTGG